MKKINIRKAANFVGDKAGALAIMAACAGMIWGLGSIAVPTSRGPETAFKRLERSLYVNLENLGPDSDVYIMEKDESVIPTTRDVGSKYVLKRDGKLVLTPDAERLGQSCEHPYTEVVNADTGKKECNFYPPEYGDDVRGSGERSRYDDGGKSDEGDRLFPGMSD